MHHGIEERFVFPMLATRMPEFKKGTGDHIKQRAYNKNIRDMLAETAVVF